MDIYDRSQTHMAVSFSMAGRFAPSFSQRVTARRMCLILLRALLKQSLLFRLGLSEMFGAASTRVRILVLKPLRERPMQRFLPPFLLSSHVDESEQPNCRSSGCRERKLLKPCPLTGFNSPVLRQRLKRLQTIVSVHSVSGWGDLSAISALSLTV